MIDVVISVVLVYHTPVWAYRICCGIATCILVYSRHCGITYNAMSRCSDSLIKAIDTGLSISISSANDDDDAYRHTTKEMHVPERNKPASAI